MKILLAGEFSGFHLNLKKGLEKLGHEVTLLSSGDGWKNINSDTKIYSAIEAKPFNKVINIIRDYLIIKNYKNYDVVQFMQPLLFSQKLGLNKYLINKLIENNKKSFLIAAGSDSMYWKNYKTKFRYSPHHDMKYIDNKGKESMYEKDEIYDYNVYLAKKVDGIIPIMYDYDIGYIDFKNKKKVIPLPMDLDTIEYQENMIKDKIVIFHGLNREGFKGTAHIKKAMERIKENYSDLVEIIIDGKMPLNEYIQLMKRTNIVIDQANSYSYGVNAVIAMAMGKIILSGCEQETLDTFGIKSSPIINILPDEDDIYQKLELLIENKDKFITYGKESREYVSLLHDYELIAHKFLSTWEESHDQLNK